jgi:hypothetical protein
MCYISYSLKLKYSNSTSHFTGKGYFINHILNNKRNSTPFNSSTISTFFLQKIVSFFSRGRKVDVRYCYMLDEKKKTTGVSAKRTLNCRKSILYNDNQQSNVISCKPLPLLQISIYCPSYLRVN